MDTPEFFLPDVEVEKQEETYAALAAWAGRSPAPPNARIYSIEFRHDGTLWTATVGHRLRGHTIADPRARAKMRRVERPVSDAATVVAIFAGAPYIVVTDSGLATGGVSAWVNPFMAGQPVSVQHFRSTGQ